MLHTTGRAGSQPKKTKWPKGIKRVSAKPKGTRLQKVRILILKFLKEYKSLRHADERSEHRWVEKWFRSNGLS